MKRADEAPQLVTAYRQFDQAGRESLVRRILELACKRLAVPADDFDLIVRTCLATHQTGTIVQRAAASVARGCVQWLEAGGTDLDFAQIVLAFGQLDARGGRQVGAIAEKTRYALELQDENRDLTAKQLYKVALGKACTGDSPFSETKGELHDIATGRIVSVRAWAKLLSAAKNPKKP